MTQDGSRAERRYPGEGGLWIFILADLLLFGLYFALFAHDISRQPALYASAAANLHVLIGLANTLVLLTSSWLVVLAVRSDPVAPRRASALLLAGAFAGGWFLLLKAVEYWSVIGGGLTITTNDFFGWYFMVTGLHALHVTAGMILLLQCALDRRRPEPVLSTNYLEGAACYWHMVDLLWIIIFTLLYLI